MNVPPQLNYNQLQTKAFFSVYKQWPIQPISNGGQYWPGQVIRIFLNALTDGVMDPYRSHIQITVQTDQSLLPVGLLQIDSSAQSFIQQIVLSSKNRQIQRIVQYGVLAAYLTDIGMSQMYSEGKQVQGLGYSNIDNYGSMYNTTYTGSSFGSMPQDSKGGSLRGYSSTGGIFPTIPSKYANIQAYGNQLVSSSMLSGVAKSHISWLNSCWLNQIPAPYWWDKFWTSNLNAPNTVNGHQRSINLKSYGYNNNIRAQYIGSYFANDYIDTTTSISKGQIRLDPDVQKIQNGFPARFRNDTVYKTYLPNMVPYGIIDDDQDGAPRIFQKIANIPSLMGFFTMISPNYAKGVRQPFISATVPQCQMKNGSILPQKIPISIRTFKIPLMSAILGTLIPQNQFVLLPLKCLNDILIQMTIDPYAMFTSGYNDISQFDNIGMGLMQQRAFKITRLVYNLHTYNFYNPQMDQYLKVSMTSGIAINTRFWQMGNQYQVQNSQSLTNSWPVACNQQALNQILVLFYPLDFQNMSFCRKHYRISNNITKLQLRLNMDYFPSQPLSGNGGNPIQLDSTGDNSVFLQQILMTYQFMFQKNKANPKINCFNFAINQRCYDIYNTHTLYDPAMIDSINYNWNPNSVNYDTAMGMANIHQNRYIGKAAYCFSFQPYSHSKQFLTGIDCRNIKSFDIIFSCNPQNWFPRPQIMFIYTCSSVIIQYSANGIVNINK